MLSKTEFDFLLANTMKKTTKTSKTLKNGVKTVKTPKTAQKPENRKRILNIVVPMAGRGSRFQKEGYSFPKPLIDVRGKAMIEVVTKNLRPSVDHRFIFIAQKEHCEKYDVYNILKNATDNQFELIQIDGITEGAVCTVLTAAQHIDNDDDLLIANPDQYIVGGIDDFIENARKSNDSDKKEKDGLIMTFESSHPKWSFARTDETGKVLETAEKRPISPHATVGLYYFRKGSDFVKGAQSMIMKDIRSNNEFYVCPVYNELILDDKNLYIHEIDLKTMHGLGTPEDLNLFLSKVDNGEVKL